MTKTTTALHARDDDEEEASPDDLRIIIKELTECWQLGDHNVMNEARSALLAVFRRSAKRLVKKHKGTPR